MKYPNKQIKFLAMTLFFLIVALLPQVLKIYHLTAYYGMLIVAYIISAYYIIFAKRAEAAFIKRWQRMRGYPKWRVICIETLKGTIIVSVPTFIGQYFGNDRSLIFLIDVLKINEMIFIGMLMVAFGVLIGYFQYTGNEKRYSKIVFKKIREQKEEQNEEQNEKQNEVQKKEYNA